MIIATLLSSFIATSRLLRGIIISNKQKFSIFVLQNIVEADAFVKKKWKKHIEDRSRFKVAEDSLVSADSFGNSFKKICVDVLMDTNWEPFSSAFFSTWIKRIHTDSYDHARTQLEEDYSPFERYLHPAGSSLSWSLSSPLTLKRRKQMFTGTDNARCRAFFCVLN